jgi:hypothetical protein
MLVMEEPEVPLETVQEHIAHHAEHSAEKWIASVALSTAIFAAFAAVASLLAGDHANEAMVSQMRASDQWSYYQAKGIKAALLSDKMELLQKSPDAEREKLEQYGDEQKEIKKEAEEKEREAAHHLHQHVILARGVTMFQIAIAIGAISALTKRRPFWFVSMIFGAFGICFLTQGLLVAW